MRKTLTTFVAIIIVTVIAALISLPPSLPIQFNVFGKNIHFNLQRPSLLFSIAGKPMSLELPLKQGLDIQGGMQVVLRADMSKIAEVDRQTALESAKEVIARRVDLYGVNEPNIQTSTFGNEYRLIVELAGVEDTSQALQLVGQTAQLDFRLESTPAAQLGPEATMSALAFFQNYRETGLTGQQLKRAQVQFDPQTNEPVIGLEFDGDGTKLFADLTTHGVGKALGIFIDGFPVALPRINTPILNGQAVMTGGFTLEDAKQLAIQLNAGALPVPIEVLEQRQVGASLGKDSVNSSVRAGLIGLGLVMLFMVLMYGVKGFLADLALVVYAILTVAVYKIFGVTVTVPGVAGLLLSIGMAVDSNILIFERMKEELRVGRPFKQAMELGFGRAWNSIKDANVVTIMTALILINPLNFGFLNTSGLVRGFGVTLLIGIVISLFTGIVVSRTLLRLFLAEPHVKEVPRV